MHPGMYGALQKQRAIVWEPRWEPHSTAMPCGAPGCSGHWSQCNTQTQAWSILDTYITLKISITPGLTHPWNLAPQVQLNEVPPKNTLGKIGESGFWTTTTLLHLCCMNPVNPIPQPMYGHFNGKLSQHMGISMANCPHVSNSSALTQWEGLEQMLKHWDTYPCFTAFINMCILFYFFQEKKNKLLVVSRVDFACFAKVHPLFKANSPVQRKQGLLKTFSSKTIAMTFDVFTVLALPYCLIIMFYNIFSPSSQALFQVPLLWNSWLHHPSSCIQWDTMERISWHLFWLKSSQLSPVCTASFPLHSSQISQQPGWKSWAPMGLLLPYWESPLELSCRPPLPWHSVGNYWTLHYHHCNEPSTG